MAHDARRRCEFALANAGTKPNARLAREDLSFALTMSSEWCWPESLSSQGLGFFDRFFDGAGSLEPCSGR